MSIKVKVGGVVQPTWMRTQFDLADVMALKAMRSGTANEEQQVRAYRWIVEKAAFNDGADPFVAENTRITDFLLGRAFVGREIMRLEMLQAPFLEKMHAAQKAKRGLNE